MHKILEALGFDRTSYFVRSLLLAVETLSPSSARFDRVVKRAHYQRKRVAGYCDVMTVPMRLIGCSAMRVGTSRR